MIKLLWLCLAASLAVRLLAGQWPWELWQGSARSAAETRARNLLGVTPRADRDAIIEAHRHLIARVHPDRGGSNDAVYEANAARDLLLGRLGERSPGPRS